MKSSVSLDMTDISHFASPYAEEAHVAVAEARQPGRRLTCEATVGVSMAGRSPERARVNGAR